MGRFKTRKICRGWSLEQYSGCVHSFMLLAPKGESLYAIKKSLSQLPGGSNNFIVNEVCDGTEIFFVSDLPFKQTIAKVAGLLNLPYTTPRHTNRPKTMKPVKQYTIDGVYIRTWDGVSLAGKTLGINPGNITNVCAGRQQTAGGFFWQF